MQGKGYIEAGEKRSLRKGMESRKSWRTGDEGRQMVGGDFSSLADVNGEIVAVH